MGSSTLLTQSDLVSKFLLVTLVWSVQFGGRGLILFGLLAAEPKLQDEEPVMWLFLTWSTIEMIR